MAKGVKSVAVGKQQSAAAVSLWRPSGEGSPLGPRGQPEQAGQLLEWWVTAFAAARSGTFDPAVPPAPLLSLTVNHCPL